MTAASEPSQYSYFQPRRIGHANIYVGELDRSMMFYNQVVGLREAYRRPPIGGGFLNNGNTHHDIGMVEVSNPIAKGARPELFHLGWELENQVDLYQGYQGAIAEGFSFDMMHDHDISHSLYFKDPAGNLNEIYADTKKRWWRDRTGNVNAPDVHWKPGQTPPDPEPNYEANPAIVRVDGAVFHPVKITGCCLVVSDYAAVVDFYVTRVGLTAVLGGANAPFTVFAGVLGMRDLALFRATESLPAQLHHLNFVCADEADLEASIAAAKAGNVEIETEIDHPSRRAVVIRDPDGLKINFYTDRSSASLKEADLAGPHGIYLA
ncbi:MAG: VOC family protein [Proteobacteria bacterium]|nr:VOC family protein [Pseudomonadota bacterium]